MVPFINGLEDEIKSNFNYHYSRCRKIVENGYGFLARKFKLFDRPMRVSPHRAEIITSAAAVLNNFIIKE